MAGGTRDGVIRRPGGLVLWFVRVDVGGRTWEEGVVEYRYV